MKIGYQTALMKSNVEFKPEYIISSDWSNNGGYSCCKELIELSTPPTAMFVMSDVMACGAAKASLESRLSIPDDLSIHGFDGLAVSELFVPSIATVKVSLYEMGIKTSENLLEVIENIDSALKETVLPCILLPGDSISTIE